MTRKEVLKFILKQLKPYKMRIIFIFVCMTGISILGMISPLIQQKFFDDGILKNDFQLIIRLTLVLISIFVFEKTLDLIQFIHYEYINKMIPYKLLHSTINHSLKLKINHYRDDNFTKFLNSTYMDISNITQIVNSSIIQSAINFFKIIGGVIGLTIINWKLTIFVLCIVPIEIILSNLFASIKQKHHKKIMMFQEKYAIWINETLKSVEIVKLWNLYNNKKREFVELQRDIIKTDMKLDYIDTFNAISSSFLITVFTNGLNLLGALLIFNNDLTLGGLFAFTSYSMYVLQPMAILANILYKLSSSIPSFERFLTFLKIPTEKYNGKNTDDLENVIQSICFENVTFSYNEEKQILKSISFKVIKGEKIAFVGLNGSGKSTILNLLLRFFDPSNGVIYINDTDIKQIALNQYRDLFSVMNQSVYMFTESIKKNINLENKLTDKEIEKYLEIVNAMNFINSLPDGLNTQVGYNGMKLSGGEKQKIALARVLSKKSKILILDEATSNFDIDAEEHFDDYITQSDQYDILIAVTHRMDILKKVDKIFVIEDGIIKDSGTFLELNSRNKDFKNILLKESERKKEDECNN